MSISPELQQAAASELLARRQARRRLVEFTRYTYPLYKADPVHELMGQYLDGVIAGELKRLMIFAPPQHGKSELTSVRLVAKWMGERPDDPVILSSYGAHLAHSKSRQARDVVESREFRALYGDLSPYDVPRQTRQDSRAVDQWGLSLPHRGGLLAVGVGGPVTGHGARLGIIDDPFENWAQAQSMRIRDHIWDWYRNAFRTRIWEGGAIVLIMTRWHEDDLAGRIIKTQGHLWEILRLPALAETQEERDLNNKRLGLPMGVGDPLGREAGEPLAPSRFSKEALLDIRQDVGEMGWNAEYQGAPSAPEGNRFKRHWFTIVDAYPH